MPEPKVELTAMLTSPRLPTLPAIALEILELMQDGELEIAELAETISKDPALAAKVLRVANSSFYAQSRTIGSIRQAIVLLGLNNVLSLALSFSLVDGLRPIGSDGFDRADFWRRSVMTGVAARQIARKLDHLHTEEAFVAGVLARIGILALSTTIPDLHTPLATDADGDYQRLREAELGQLGFSHVDAGAQLTERWNLPESLVAVVRHIDDTEAAPDHFRRFCEMICLADVASALLCHRAAGDVGRYRRLALKWFDIGRSEADELLMLIDEGARDVLPLFQMEPSSLPPAAEILSRANEALAEVNTRIEFENAQLRIENESLERRATSDPLTTLANRGHFESFAQEQIELSNRHGAPLALLFLDLDGFKRVNDSFGHQAGDIVLRRLGDTLRESARSFDLVARYGGDEFAIVMPSTSRDEARVAAERIRVSFGDRAIGLLPETHITLSVSIGIATYEEGLDSLESWIRRADRAVYQAKRLGGNRIVIGHRNAA